MNGPLISIVAPVYNNEVYLPAFIESVLSQVYSNWELILVDDCSPIMMYPDLDYHKLESQVLYNKIDKFQIRQDKVGDIQVLLKMKDKADENPAKYDFIVTNYRNHFVGSEVSLSFVDEIPVLPSGKEDYCVSEFEYEG